MPLLLIEACAYLILGASKTGHSTTHFMGWLCCCGWVDHQARLQTVLQAAELTVEVTGCRLAGQI